MVCISLYATMFQMRGRCSKLDICSGAGVYNFFCHFRIVLQLTFLLLFPRPPNIFLSYLNSTNSNERNLVVWDIERSLMDLVDGFICRRCQDRKKPADFQPFQMSTSLLQDHHGEHQGNLNIPRFHSHRWWKPLCICKVVILLSAVVLEVGMKGSGFQEHLQQLLGFCSCDFCNIFFLENHVSWKGGWWWQCLPPFLKASMN